MLTLPMMITLRNISKDDFLFLFELDNSPEGVSSGIGKQHVSLLVVKEFVDNQLHLPFFARKSLIQIIETTKPIGYIEIFNYDIVKNEAEIGILIQKEHQSHGYGSSALEIFLDLLKNEYKIASVYAEIDFENEISINLFKKNGFVEGVHGEYYRCEKAL
jgi:RimJ/RimL family protein N-acetyltransferase